SSFAWKGPSALGDAGVLAAKTTVVKEGSAACTLLGWRIFSERHVASSAETASADRIDAGKG
ncbi:hypothetical protein EBZ37_11160, partial [bacterium]|nr:hypothetical protein [bacterium]